MSSASDEIEVCKRILAKLAEEYASIDSSEDRSMQFFEEFASLFDEYFARSRLNGEPDDVASSWWRSGLRRASTALASLAYAVKYGTLPLGDRLVEAFQAGLEKQQRIKPGDRRTLNIYRMIRFHDDGRCEVELARTDSYRRARMWLALVVVVTLVALFVVVTILSGFIAGLPIAYTLGAIVGWLARDVFNGAWGRDKLARALNQRLSFLKLRVPTPR